MSAHPRFRYRFPIAPGVLLSRRVSRRLVRMGALAVTHHPHCIHDQQTKWSASCPAILSDGKGSLEALTYYPPPLSTRAGRRIAPLIPKRTN